MMKFFILHKTLINHLHFQPLSYSLLLIAVAGLLTAQAQQPAFTQKAPTYELEYIPMPEQNGKFSISNMAEDKQGFIWMATNCGLVCWDGQKAIAYSAANKSFKLPLQENSFSYFATDKDGLIYNCQDGFNQFDPYNRSLKKTNGLLPRTVLQQDGYEFLINSRSELFIVVTNDAKQYLKVFKNTGNEYVPILTRHFEYRRDKFINALPDNKFVFSIKDSIFIYDSEGKTIKKIAHSGHEFSCLSACNTPVYSAIFFDNTTQKIFALNRQSLELEFFADLSFLSGSTVNKMTIKDSLLWIAGNQRLQLINLASHSYQDLSEDFIALIKKNYPLNLSTIGANTFVCKNGNVFLWTENVVIRLRKKQPLATEFKETVIDKLNRASLSFRALAEDDAKNIYASYYSGIAKQTGGKGPFKWLNFPIGNKLKDEGVYGLFYHNKALYWNNVKLQLPSLAATFISGNKFGGHTTLFKQGDSLWLYPWQDNKLYAASLNTSGARLLADFTSQGIDNITAMIADPDGRHIWYSSLHFITKIDKAGNVAKEWSKQVLNELYDQVHCLYIKNNYLWFGWDKGLGTVDLTTYQIKLYKQPVVSPGGNLKDVVIFSMLPYRDSLLILGTNMGIHLFNIHQHTWYNLDKNHPLSQIEFNRSSTLLASGGRCYFGSIDGLFSFFPDQLPFTKSSTANLTLHLVNMSWYDQQKKQAMHQWENLSTLTSITLAPNESNLELEFSVPDFDNTIFYSFRIVGYNDLWQDENTIGKVNIGNLKPGDYTIEVKASTSLNDNNPVYYKLKLLVQEQWYNKWWVKVVALLLITGLVWWFASVQIKKRLAKQQQIVERQKELAALRTKISSDLHDDVGSILTGLAMQSQNIAMIAKEETKKELDEIVEMSREAMERMRDTVWAIDSRKDKYVNLIDRMRSFAEQQLSTKNIMHQFEVDMDDPEAFIDPVRRQNIYLIFKELITNILKHSDATDILIKFTYKKSQLYLLVHDNGTQQKEKKTDGMGISNIALRTKNIKGSFTIHYENGFKAQLQIEDEKTTLLGY